MKCGKCGKRENPLWKLSDQPVLLCEECVFKANQAGPGYYIPFPPEIDAVFVDPLVEAIESANESK